MKTFKPCQGKTVCRDDGRQCLTCGRTFPEIEQTRALLNALADLALAHDYGNVEEFAAYIARKLEKKVRQRREGGISEV